MRVLDGRVMHNVRDMTRATETSRATRRGEFGYAPQMRGKKRCGESGEREGEKECVCVRARETETVEGKLGREGRRESERFGNILVLGHQEDGCRMRADFWDPAIGLT